MGKKNKKGKSGVAESDCGMPRHVRREILEIVNILLEKCSTPFGGGSGTEWNDYLDVYKLVEKLRKKQQCYAIHHTAREQHMPAFLQWLSDNGVDLSAVSIDKFEGVGYGLKAARDIEKADLILSVPRKLMMTSATAKSSVLGPLMQEDRILQTMPNVAMSLHVLCEMSSPDSFWLPYLKTLPDIYTTPLYFTPDEIMLLKGSPVLSEILNQFRNVTRQYAYFFRLFQGHLNAAKLPIKNFCFDDYRWSVSTVMTRQNQIPAIAGEEADTALIPLWDMCNHTAGQITTDYNDKASCSDCYAVQRFACGDQVLIFYGPRSNSELLLHNGFIFDANEHDRLAIRIGLSKNDHLYSMKAEVLARLPLSTARVFYLYADAMQPVESSLLAYLRVFAMDQDTLLSYLMGEDADRRRQMLRDLDRPVSADNETKAWAFLETRAELLLRAYQTTVEEDTELLSKSNLVTHASLAVRLRRAEKIILLGVVRYAGEQKSSAVERAAISSQKPYGSHSHHTGCHESNSSDDHHTGCHDPHDRHDHHTGCHEPRGSHGHPTPCHEPHGSHWRPTSCHDSCACEEPVPRASHVHHGACTEPGEGDVRVMHVPKATGEEEFVRIDNVRVYGSMEERIAVEKEFRNSVLRGDYLTRTASQVESTSSDLPATTPSESEVQVIEGLRIEESIKADGDGEVDGAASSGDTQQLSTVVV